MELKFLLLFVFALGSKMSLMAKGQTFLLNDQDLQDLRAGRRQLFPNQQQNDIKEEDPEVTTFRPTLPPNIRLPNRTPPPAENAVEGEEEAAPVRNRTRARRPQQFARRFRTRTTTEAPSTDSVDIKSTSVNTSDTAAPAAPAPPVRQRRPFNVRRRLVAKRPVNDTQNEADGGSPQAGENTGSTTAAPKRGRRPNFVPTRPRLNNNNTIRARVRTTTTTEAPAPTTTFPAVTTARGSTVAVTTTQPPAPPSTAVPASTEDQDTPQPFFPQRFSPFAPRPTLPPFPTTARQQPTTASPPPEDEPEDNDLVTPTTSRPRAEGIPIGGFNIGGVTFGRPFGPPPGSPEAEGDPRIRPFRPPVPENIPQSPFSSGTPSFLDSNPFEERFPERRPSNFQSFGGRGPQFPPREEDRPRRPIGANFESQVSEIVDEGEEPIRIRPTEEEIIEEPQRPIRIRPQGPRRPIGVQSQSETPEPPRRPQEQRRPQPPPRRPAIELPPPPQEIEEEEPPQRPSFRLQPQPIDNLPTGSRPPLREQVINELRNNEAVVQEVLRRKPIRDQLLEEVQGNRFLPSTPDRGRNLRPTEAPKPQVQTKVTKKENESDIAVEDDQAKPALTVRRYNKENDDGSFTFGYESSDGSYREETRGVDCVVRGKYGYVDPDGVKREYTYVSGNPCDPNKKDEEEFDEEGRRVVPLDGDEEVPPTIPSRPAPTRPSRPLPTFQEAQQGFREVNVERVRPSPQTPAARPTTPTRTRPTPAPVRPQTSPRPQRPQEPETTRPPFLTSLGPTQDFAPESRPQSPFQINFGQFGTPFDRRPPPQQFLPRPTEDEERPDQFERRPPPPRQQFPLRPTEDEDRPNPFDRRPPRPEEFERRPPPPPQFFPRPPEEEDRPEQVDFRFQATPRPELRPFISAKGEDQEQTGRPSTPPSPTTPAPVTFTTFPPQPSRPQTRRPEQPGFFNFDDELRGLGVTPGPRPVQQGNLVNSELIFDPVTGQFNTVIVQQVPEGNNQQEEERERRPPPPPQSFNRPQVTVQTFGAPLPRPSQPARRPERPEEDRPAPPQSRPPPPPPPPRPASQQSTPRPPPPPPSQFRPEEPETDNENDIFQSFGPRPLQPGQQPPRPQGGFTPNFFPNFAPPQQPQTSFQTFGPNPPQFGRPQQQPQSRPSQQEATRFNQVSPQPNFVQFGQGQTITSFPGGNVRLTFGPPSNPTSNQQQFRPQSQPQSFPPPGFQQFPPPPNRLFGGFQPVAQASSDIPTRARPGVGFQPFQGFFGAPQQQGFRPPTTVTRFGNPNVSFGPPGFQNQ